MEVLFMTLPMPLPLPLPEVLQSRGTSGTGTGTGKGKGMGKGKKRHQDLYKFIPSTIIRIMKPINAEIDRKSLILKPKGPQELRCWEMATAQGAWIRSKAMTEKSDADAFLGVAQHLDDSYKAVIKRSTPLRLLSCQLCLPDLEWGQVAAQHLWLTWLTDNYGLSAQNGHVVVQTEPFYQPKNAKGISDFYQHSLNQLCHMHNIDAWAEYAFWMTEEIEQIVGKIHLEQLDMFTLEALFKDFILEQRTTLLRQDEQNVADTVLRLGALRKELDYPVREGDTIIDLEKHLMKSRSETKQRLIVQQRILVEIARLIGIIERAHPDLLVLRRKAALLGALLGSQLALPGYSVMSWGQLLMVMQLWHEEMGIVSALCSDNGLERTSRAFAVQLAISLLKQAEGVDAAIQVALQWGSESQQGRSFVLQHIAMILDRLCIPMTKEYGLGSHAHESEQENLAFLQLLPHTATIHDAKGKPVEVPLVRLDASGKPTSLTKAGHYLMSHL